MKENWIKKLIELLNEYEKEVKKSEIVWSIDNDWDICRQTYEWVDYNEYTEYMNTNNLISKSFWFIKWLVDNEKIDRNNVREGNYWREFNDYWTIPNSKRDKEIQIERLLMILSIQDNPIEFLCSVLK